MTSGIEIGMFVTLKFVNIFFFDRKSFHVVHEYMVFVSVFKLLFTYIHK